MDRMTKCVDMLKKLKGLPPYDKGSNYVRGDSFFAKSIRDEFNAEEISAAKQILQQEG